MNVGWIVPVQQKKVEQVISNLKLIHGDLYEYIQPLNMPTIEGLEVSCKAHGRINQSIRMMLKGNGCFGCYGAGKPYIFDVIRDFQNLWGCVYDYSETKYHRNTLKIKIICEDHGQFWMKPITHLKGNGCPYCKERGVRYPNHVESKLDMLGMSAKVHLMGVRIEKVVCPLHGEFEMVVKRKDRRCPSCKEVKTTTGRKGLMLSQITSFDGLECLTKSINQLSEVAQKYEKSLEQ